MVGKGIKENYLTKRLHCRCVRCDNNFIIDVSCDDSLVKFCSVNSNEIKWLPLLGESGYIELLSKLVKGRKRHEPIDMNTVKIFEEELNKKFNSTNRLERFRLDRDIRICPKCNSKELHVIKEEIIKNPELSWLEV